MARRALGHITCSKGWCLVIYAYMCSYSHVLEAADRLLQGD